jgi:hypothetical protein
MEFETIKAAGIKIPIFLIVTPLIFLYGLFDNAVSFQFPIWSSDQISWIQIQRSGFDSRHYQVF